MESMDPKISDSINKEKNNGESKQKRNDKQSRGTSGKNTKNYRISVPVGMIKALGVTEDDRSVVLEEKDGVITIKKEK